MNETHAMKKNSESINNSSYHIAKKQYGPDLTVKQVSACSYILRLLVTVTSSLEIDKAP